MPTQTARSCKEPSEYATHLPVLEMVAREVKPRRVLEFGAGDYSTPFFLSLPHLQELRSVEPSPKWRKRLSEKHDDSRFILQATGRPRPRYFDLIFIDDGHDQAEREETIRYVLSHNHPPTVIHDAEVYEPCIREFAEPVIFDDAMPSTAVIW